MWPFPSFYRKLERRLRAIEKDVSLNLRTYESKLMQIQTAYEVLNKQHGDIMAFMRLILKELNGNKGA